MSQQPNDGGPAYPITLNPHEYWDLDAYGSPNGMSIRDYFAGEVSSTLLDGYITAICSKGEGLAGEAMELAAKGAYMMADAMLAERAKGGDQ